MTKAVARLNKVVNDEPVVKDVKWHAKLKEGLKNQIWLKLC